MIRYLFFQIIFGYHVRKRVLALGIKKPKQRVLAFK